MASRVLVSGSSGYLGTVPYLERYSLNAGFVPWLFLLLRTTTHSRPLVQRYLAGTSQ
jgi:hypothetical protein